MTIYDYSSEPTLLALIAGYGAEMSYTYPCPICTEPVKHETDYHDNVLMEGTASCEKCGLFNSYYCCGYYEMKVGFWDWKWGWDADQDENRQRQLEYETATRSTHALLADPEWPLWKRTTTAWPENEPDLFRAFSDWNRERGREELADQVQSLLEVYLR